MLCQENHSTYFSSFLPTFFLAYFLLLRFLSGVEGLPPAAATIS